MHRLRIWRLLLVLCCSVFPIHSPAQGVITTVAGTSLSFRGDGGPATNAPLGAIRGLAVDSAGNVFATNLTHHLVVKVAASGILTVVAGNGIAGFSGDAGPATTASLNEPWGVAVDAAGNLYIADSANHRVRKVSPSGIVTVVAGSGVAGFAGDAGPAAGASLNAPSGIAVDSAGNLYIADSENNRIRKVSSGGTITTVAGGGGDFPGEGGPATSASLNRPRGVAVDAAGSLYIADSLNHRVRKVSAGGTITTVAGSGTQGFSGDGGPATGASLNEPRGVTVDSGGNLFVADTRNHRVRKVSSSGTISTMAGNGTQQFSGDGGPATSASLSSPYTLAVDTTGNLYIADTGNNRVRKVSAGGTITTVAGVGSPCFFGDGGPASSAFVCLSSLIDFSVPSGVAVDASGSLYLGDTDNDRIRKVSAEGTITTVAGGGGNLPGDGGPATAAALFYPSGVAVDGSGNFYIADTFLSRIRRVSPDGTITTVAGPGTSAPLLFPAGVAVDASGNLYIADTYNNRIRKLTPGGSFTTVAGTGLAGIRGDGGPATNAWLDLPQGVAVDASGNLYIADTANDAIRKVNPSGIITTIVGEVDPFFDMVFSPLSSPTGLALDAAGNLFIADTGNHRIYRLSPTGTGSTVAGRHQERGFSGDGDLATRATLRLPSGVAVDAAGNIYIADTENHRIRKVLAARPSFSVAPATLAFSAPTGAPVVAPRQIAVASAVTGLGWVAQASTESGSNWLAISPRSGSVPGIITVVVNLAGLAPGTYRGTVTAAAPVADPPSQTVSVELTVQAALAAQLSLEPSSLTFESASGASNPPTQVLRISNAGGGTLNWTVKAESGAGNWLTVSPASGTASAGSPATVQVSANVAGLTPGVYSGSVRVDSSTTNESKTVAVTLLLSQVTQTILVSQSGLLFTGVEGGGAVPSQSFGILNTGQGTMNWTVQASTLSGGNWLNVSPASGRSDAASLQISLVDVTVNVSGLRAGQYSGLIRVNSPGANNSPQFVTVDLTVLPAGSNPGVLVRPTGLIFAAPAGTSSPGSQIVRLSTAAPGTVQFVSGLLTLDGGNWLQALPQNATLSATDPRNIIIQPTLGSLAPGVYRGTLTLLFGDGSSQTVNILFVVVAPAAAAGSGAEAMDLGTGQPCVPQKLLAVHRSLGSSFSSQVGWPSHIEIQVVDDCGGTVPNATVVAAFSSGDPPLALVSLRNGTYVGTWRPVNPAGQVAVTVRGSLPPLAPAEVQAQGQVRSNPTVPALFAGGIVNAASFASGQALAPGSIVSVFGRNLAASTTGASGLPLPTTLGGATLNIGGIDVPLFFSSDGQINAQLPFELTPNSRPHVVVKRSEAITVPETITIATARPGIFTTNQQGTGQGAILDAQGRLPDSAAPAAAGDIVQVFCTGLGLTEPRVDSGRPAPSQEPLARVLTAVEATVGGRPATVHFAGLAPNFAGLYQVNVQIPAGLEPGSNVPFVLLQNGVPSNTVTLAVR